MGFYGGWAPYVPVAKRRADTRKKMDKLRKKGMNIQPVEIEGRKIARSFWGISWCEHLETFSDYENRLPRGRTYVRNGSVCHLEIKSGEINAMVSGSEIYNIKIEIKALEPEKWSAIKTRCAGQIGSLLELLQGKFSDNVMSVVTDNKNGLFPLSGEMKMNCDCPDWAGMCKHVAAVLYGVGARLDESPELLFILRGVDQSELISTEISIDTTGGKRRGRRIADNAISDIFDIEMSEETTATKTEPEKSPKSEEPEIAKAAKTKTPKAKKDKSAETKAPKAKKDKSAKTKTPRAKKDKSAKAKAPKAKKDKVTKNPEKIKETITQKAASITGYSVKMLRLKLRLRPNLFGLLMDVTPGTVRNWENKDGLLSLRTKYQEKLQKLLQMNAQEAQEELQKKGIQI